METAEAQNQITFHPLYEFAIEQYIKQEKDTYEIRNLLIERGVEESEARQIAFYVTDIVARLKREKGRQELFIGMAFIITGVFTSYFSYAMAVERGGGIYVVNYGMVIFGFIAMFRGAYKLS